MKEFIDKLISVLKENHEEVRNKYLKGEGNFAVLDGRMRGIEDASAIIKSLAKRVDMGKISDGYHTFNELYHHRAVLFSVICNLNKEKAWKSKLHDTGDMYEGMFIVGIETPEGQATYHYDINPYWDMFKVKELPKAPKWDGHSPDEAIRRLSLLAEEFAPDINVDTKVSEMPIGWIPCSSGYFSTSEVLVCKEDGTIDFDVYDFMDNDWKFNSNHHKNKVIAWQPLPAPYTEGE